MNNHDVLVKFYSWAFSECDRIDLLKDQWEAQFVLMNVNRKVNKVSLHTTVDERNSAIEQALLFVDKLKPERKRDGSEYVQRSPVEPSTETR